MSKDLIWDKYENARIERAKAEVAQIKARRAAVLADETFERAINAERTFAAEWRAAVRTAAGTPPEGAE